MVEPKLTGSPLAERWLAPQDGGRGREVRVGRVFRVRMFSWRYWSLSLLTGGFYTAVTLYLFGTSSSRGALFGAWFYKDEDDEFCIDAGFWPLLVQAHAGRLFRGPSPALRQWAEMEDD